MTTSRPAESITVARAINSRLRVGHLIQAGQATTLTQIDTTTYRPTCLLAARLLPAPGGYAIVADNLAQEVTISPPDREGKQLASVPSRQQLRLQRAMNVRGLGVLFRPKVLDSTSWSVVWQMTEIASVYTSGDERHRHTMGWMSNHGPTQGSEAAPIREALADGLLVILATGGPLVLDTLAEGEFTTRARLHASLACSPTVPRHYVLALPWRAIGQEDPGEGCAHICEPSSGAVRPFDLTTSRDPHRSGPRELGSRPRVLVVIAPKN